MTFLIRLSVDLSDPAKPRVTGELKITGYSAHLQPVGENRLVGIGQEADQNGRRQGTQVSLFDQGLVQVLQAAVTGLKPKQPYVLALADDVKGTGTLQPLASFMTNPAGAAIVNAVGPIRQIVTGDGGAAKRYLVIAPAEGGKPGAPVQLQQ